jgi:hypothetical protein
LRDFSSPYLLLVHDSLGHSITVERLLWRVVLSR